MSNSFSFNSVDMSAYGLRLRTHEESFNQETPAVQLLDKAYGLNSLRPAGTITLDVAIYAANITTLKSYLDSIRSALNHREDKELKIDTFTDRYWLARCVGMEGSITTARIWQGMITFACHDPAAFDNDEEDSDHTID